MVVCSGTVNYTAGGIGKGFPGSLVAVGGSLCSGPNVSLTKNMKCGAYFSLLAAPFFPDSK